MNALDAPGSTGAAELELEMELTDEELECVVGGLSRIPATPQPAAA